MPLAKPEDYGTEATGQPAKEYCAHCYARGAFLAPDLTMDQMRERCIDKMVERAVMPRALATAVMTEALPKLKRWRGAPPTA
jgi:hypothetical protein